MEVEAKLWRAKAILSPCYKHLRRSAAHKYMLRITESVRLREPCVSRGIHTRDNVTETASFVALARSRGRSWRRCQRHPATARIFRSLTLRPSKPWSRH